MAEWHGGPVRVPHPPVVSFQGVIADLKLRADPRAAERQCEEEEDDAEVSAGSAAGAARGCPRRAQPSPLLHCKQVSGDFGSGMEGGQQPSGKVEVSCCPQVLHPEILVMRRAECPAWPRSRGA